jgi:hypothetical protein
VQALDTLRQQKFDAWKKAYDAAEEETANDLSIHRLAVARAARTGAA